MNRRILRARHEADARKEVPNVWLLIELAVGELSRRRKCQAVSERPVGEGVAKGGGGSCCWWHVNERQLDVSDTPPHRMHRAVRQRLRLLRREIAAVSRECDATVPALSRWRGVTVIVSRRIVYRTVTTRVSYSRTTKR